jgi:hypothetical protein
MVRLFFGSSTHPQPPLCFAKRGLISLITNNFPLYEVERGNKRG